MFYGEVYCISNNINDKKYIGITTRNVNTRFNEHSKTNSYIGNAIRKHGKDNFNVKVISSASCMRELCEKEIQYIDEYKAFGKGYNLTFGGEGVDNIERVFVEHTKEQKEFILYAYKENNKEIDVEDRYESIKAILINLILMYLTVDKVTDKKLVARHIYKLKEQYIESIKNTKLIDFNELNMYLQ